MMFAGSHFEAGDILMKSFMNKRLFCCLLAALFVLCSIPMQSTAAGGIIVFSTMEELRDYCDNTKDFSGASLCCEETDFLISEDLVIPARRTVAFRHFTVPEGITLTVMQGAEVKTYGFTVQGEFINYGTVFQGDLSGDGAIQVSEIAARIPGKVVNKGEMTLTDVYGKRNIRWLGSQFTMIETDSYREKLQAEVNKDSPEATASPTPEIAPTPKATPQSKPTEELRRQVLKFLDELEVILPRLAFFFVIVLFGIMVKVGLAERKKEKNAQGNPSSPPETLRRGTSGKTDSFRQEYTLLRDTHAEDHFQRDSRKRISQLDDWLKSGIIDRKEYNELKSRYENSAGPN